MKIAIADIGSNTVKMTVFSEDGQVLLKQSTPVGLIGYIKDGLLSEEGIRVLVKTLAKYGAVAKKEGAKTLYPFATASLRAASNRQHVMEEVKRQTGFVIDLVSGEEEAALTLDGISFAMGKPVSGATVLDMGGGSCEVMAAESKAGVSLPVGALALFVKTVRNVLPTAEELTEIYRYTQTLGLDASIGKREGEVFAVGGSLRAFALFHAHVLGRHFSEDVPYRITREESVRLLALVTEAKPETKLTLLRLLPERIHTFAAGVTAVLALLDLLGKDAFTVVQGGAREGYFVKLKKALNA